jgi:ABC-type transporter Mla subunit MlaD
MKLFKVITITAMTALVALRLGAAEGKPSILTMEKVRSDLANLSMLVGSSGAALQKVKDSAKSSSELNSALKDFSDKYAAVESQADTVRINVINMKARTKEYHEAWLKELDAMKNPKLKEKASSRFEDVKKEFTKIIEAGDKAKHEFVPYVTDLKDIKVYLDADSTPDAVNTLSNTIWKLGNQSKSVSAAIQNVVEQIDRTLSKSPSK